MIKIANHLQSVASISIQLYFFCIIFFLYYTYVRCYFVYSIGSKISIAIVFNYSFGLCMLCNRMCVCVCVHMTKLFASRFAQCYFFLRYSRKFNLIYAVFSVKVFVVRCFFYLSVMLRAQMTLDLAVSTFVLRLIFLILLSIAI